MLFLNSLLSSGNLFTINILWKPLRPGIHIIYNETLAIEACKHANTIFHPVNTCRMGNDEKAVVNDRLLARGLQNLRIVNASIMPNITSEILMLLQ